MHLLLVLVLFSMVNGDTRNHMIANRTTIVHLFEWKWKDIADECERFLAPKGYGGVQISPPSENLIIHLCDGRRPWYERYQVMSYKLVTRSGNQDEFLDMTRRCNNVGVRIYPDVVINHMTGSPADNRGTGGSTADFDKYYYPGVPYNASHFHNPHCGINDYNNANEVRNCELSGLKDLNQSDEYVRDKIVGFLNQLIKLGVAGFRVDAAKHMWPGDLEAIYKRLDNLEPAFGFPVDARPYIYQEVIYYGGGEPVRPDSYTPLGDVTEFRVGALLKDAFRGRNPLKYLISWGQQWGLMPSETALTFIDNHDTQRSDDVLTYKEARAYKAAIGFMLAHPYGNPRVMSSFFFGNREEGPPSDDHENILSQSVNGDACSNGWVCEHRWRQIYQMVAFRNAVEKAPIQNWWDNGNKQIAFGRGDRGFIVFNGEFAASLDQTLQTGLPAGEYCDVISGKRVGTQCTGRKITVHNNGFAHFYIPENHENVHLAIHVGTESRI